MGELLADLEERLEETRRARSILLSMPGFSPADLWDDDGMINFTFLFYLCCSFILFILIIFGLRNQLIYPMRSLRNQ